MTERARLPNRRQHETIAIEFAGQRFKLGLGRALLDSQTMRLGPVGEVFLNAQKPNSSLDCIASEGAILLSLLLQHGVPIAELAHTLKRNPDGSPASPFGFAADLILNESSQQEGQDQ